MKLNPKNTALVLIEFQNDFTSEGGVFHGAVKGVMESNNMLQNTVELADKVRKAGVTIVYVPVKFAEDYKELTSTPYGILKGVVDNGAFKKDQWGLNLLTGLNLTKATSSSTAKEVFADFQAPILILF